MERISNGEDSRVMMSTSASLRGHFIPALLLTEPSFVLRAVLLESESLFSYSEIRDFACFDFNMNDREKNSNSAFTLSKLCAMNISFCERKKS